MWCESCTRLTLDLFLHSLHGHLLAWGGTGSHVLLACTRLGWNAKQVVLGRAGSGQGSGRAVVGLPESKQVEGTAREGGAQHIDARFSIGAQHNLATKVMSNGVEVIVAGKCMDLICCCCEGKVDRSCRRSSTMTNI